MGTFNQFKCQWLSGGSGTVIITEPIQAIEDDPIAYAALAIAIAFGLICLCLILLEKLKEKKQNVK